MNKYFFPGLGEKPSEYKNLSKYLTILDVDWNTGKYTPQIKKPKLVATFSLGVILGENIKTDILVLCSPTPGAETLKDVKAKKVIFIVGLKEDWIHQDIIRVAKTLPCPWQIIEVEGDHKISGKYLKKLIEVVESY